MYDNDPAVIDLQINIDEQGAEKSVDNFVSRLKDKLAQIQSMINNASVSSENRQALQERYESISKTVNEMSSLVDKTKEAGAAAINLNQQIRNMGRVMKGQSVSGYEGTTAEIFEQTKEAAKEARVEYQRANEELGKKENVKTLVSVNQEIQNIDKSIGEMETELRHSKGTDAFKVVGDEAKRSAEEMKRYAKAVANARALLRERGRNKEPTETMIKAEERRLIEEEKRAEEEKLRIEKAQEEAIKKENAAHRQQIQALNEEKRRIKEGASQYYYRLRAIKMLDHVLEQVNGSLDRFAKKSVSVAGKTTKLWFKMATPFGLLAKYVKKASDSLKSFSKDSKSATKSHDGFVDSMKRGVWTIIKYTFGIRSLYFLFNKLRRALGTGMENLATQYDHVNQQMSSVVSSLERMKNAVAAMVQPLLNVLAPALEKISELFANLAYNVASFFATLTGQDFVYYAKRIKKGYIEDKKAAKDYNDEVDRQLSNLDKLNVLTTPKDKKNKDDEDTPIDMFDIKPISAKAKDWLKKLKDFLKPITNAWAKEGQFVVDSWKYAWQEIVKLAKDIWRDFLKVWFEPETERIFENVFHIIGDIGLVVGNLAKNFRKAWNFDNNGYRILKAIRDIILSITERLREAADYTVKWSEKLNFIPLMTTLAGVLENQVVPAVDKVMALLVKLYEEVFLELVRYMIEDLGPIITRIFGNIAEIIGDIAENFRIAWSECGLGRKIVEKIEEIITDIARAIEGVTNDTKKWAKTLNFRPLLRSTYKLLDKIEPVIKGIANTLRKFWREVILPISKDFIEKKLPKMMDTVVAIIDKVDKAKLSSAMDKLFGVISKFWDKYGDTMLLVITKIVDKIVEFINSGKLESWLDRISAWLDKIDPNTLADWIINIGKAWIVIRASSGIIEKITTSLSGLWTTINFFRQWNMLSKLGKISTEMGNIKTGIDNIASSAGKASGAVGGIGGAAKSSAALTVAANAAIVLAILAVVAVTVTLWTTNEEFRAVVTQVWEDIKKTFSDASQSIVDSINTLGFEFDDMKDVWLWFCNEVAPFIAGTFIILGKRIEAFATILTGVVRIVVGAGNTIVGVIDIVVGSFKRDAETIKRGTERIVNGANELKGGFIDAGNGLVKLGTTGVDVFGQLYNEYKFGKDALSDYNKTAEESEKVQSNMNQQLKTSSEEFKKLGNVYVDSKGNVLTYQGVMARMRQDLDSTSSSADNVSISLNNLPSSMSPELAQSLQNINSQLDNMDMKLGDMDMSGFENLDNHIDTTNAKLGNIDMSGFENLNSQIETTDTMLNDIDMSGFINSMETDIPAATTDAGNAISNLSDTAVQLAPEMEKVGADSVAGLKQGMDTGFTDLIVTFMPGRIGDMLRVARSVLAIGSPSKKFDEIGRFSIQGLVNGINALASAPVNAIKSVANSVINAARAALSPSKLVSIGKNLLSGLASGIRSGVSNAVTAIQGAANTVIEAAKRRFQVHSPSKIFEDIGKMLDEGLAVGVDKNTDDVTDAFDNMVPDNQFLELFYEKFTGMLSSLREESVSIVDSMIDEIETAIARMDNLAMLESLSTQLSNISNMRIPDIAVGAKVPDNEKFAQTQTVDLSSLPKMLKSAFIEAFAETEISSLQTGDSGDIIVEVDGYEIMRVVQKENTKYKKQTGRSAFA